MKEKYKNVYEDIKKDILFNHYRAGNQMPTQETLAKKYHISRMTLKKVLHLLQEEGLIYSKQGSGTFVRPRLFHENNELLPLNAPIGTTYSHRDQDIQTIVHCFEARLATQKECHMLALNAGQAVYHIQRVRKINHHFYSHEDIIIPTAITTLNETIVQHSIYDYLGKQHIFITDAQRIVYATPATKPIAQALHIPLHDAVLVIEQLAYDQKGRAFEYSTSSFVGKQSQFVLDVHL